MDEFELTSPAFEHGQRIPRKHTCEGEDVSPPLAWSGVPEGTGSLALVVDDPDAPGGTFTHSRAWGIDAGAGGLGEGEAPPFEDRNDCGSVGWGGPMPPGHGHTATPFGCTRSKVSSSCLPAQQRPRLSARSRVVRSRSPSWSASTSGSP